LVPKLQNLAGGGVKIRHLGVDREKIDILSTHDLLCWKFAAVCRKIATSCPPSFLTLNAADTHFNWPCRDGQAELHGE